MWDEITHPFPNFNGVTVEVWQWISNSILISEHVIIAGFKVNKMGPWCTVPWLDCMQYIFVEFHYNDFLVMQNCSCPFI